jgi:general secretion pathway protein F
MTVWRYRAADGESELREGEIEAVDEIAAAARLQTAGLMPLRLRPMAAQKAAAPTERRGRALKLAALAATASQTAVLLGSGLALDEALDLSADFSQKPREAEVLRTLLERIRSGASLAEAMTAEQGVFPDFAVSMVRAGEEAGSLESALARLSEFIEQSLAWREAVISALLYPAVVALVCCGSIGVLFAFVVPRFAPLFAEAGDALPASARALLATSDLVQNWWWTLPMAALLLFLGARRALRTVEGRRRWDHAVLKLPVVGSVVAKMRTVHFARTLGTLIDGGVPLVPALQIARETAGNVVFAEAIDAVLEQAKSGKGLAEPLRHTGIFPPLACRLMAVAEESGRQKEMLLKIADTLEAETRRLVTRLMTLLTPALTVILGVVVAAVIGSILTAVLSVYDLAM